MISTLLLLLLLLPASVQADESQCEDAAAYTDWQERSAKHPEDVALQTLHALWIGLCVKVQHHEITTDQASEIFEHSRQRFVERRREHNGTTEQKPNM
jgi:hypothetical protein